MDLLGVVVCLTLTLTLTLGFEQGAPPKACYKMQPVHTNTQPQRSPNPYRIELDGKQRGTRVEYYPGMELTVRLTGPFDFAGFMIQARDSHGEPVGAFRNVPDKTHTVRCGHPDSTWTHSDDSKKNNLEVQWQAPREEFEYIEFVGSIAQSRVVYWTNLEARLDASDDRDSSNDGGSSRGRGGEPVYPPFTTDPDRGSAVSVHVFWCSTLVAAVCIFMRKMY